MTNAVNVMKIFTSDFELVFEKHFDYHTFKTLYQGTECSVLENNGDFFWLNVYKTKSGNNQTYNNKALAITFTRQLMNLTKVKVNDVELSSDKYTAMSRSTIITLKNDYLKTLTKGTYTLKVEYTSEWYASAPFVILETNPPTCDKIIGSVLLRCATLIGITSCRVFLGKKEKIINIEFDFFSAFREGGFLLIV